ncbi:MAG: SGNH/GDSL hydrolase family protein [Bacteroidota bacterium]|nr:SGNH/GDSL hydrolase family protein [Bacteroidota bacterium]
MKTFILLLISITIAQSQITNNHSAAGVLGQSDFETKTTGTINLISPNGFQQWEVGKVKNILFSSLAVDSVKIEFTTSNGTSWQTIIASTSAALGKYQWSVPSTISNQYRIKISNVADGSVIDSSENMFSVIPVITGNEQDFVVFNESAVSDFHDASYAAAFTPPSTIENNNTKIPVSSKFSLNGTYSIKLNWVSVPGGDWGAAIANPGWVGQDITLRDSLSFIIFTEDTTKSNGLPVFYVEDLSNKKSAKLDLTNFISSVPAKQWYRIVIPVSILKSNVGTADLTKIKTIFFGQRFADSLRQIWYIGDMRWKGKKIISGDSTRVIVVLGSSTSAGTGATTADSSWVGRFKNYVKKQDSSAFVINLAVGGYTTYDLMPSSFIPPAGRPAPKANNNVTYALTYKPDAIVINLPSNDVAYGYSIAEQLSNYNTILAGVPKSIYVWVTTTQPRNLDATGRTNLMAMRDSTYARFKTNTLDFWTTIANNDGTINSLYGSGDGIHLNNVGHRVIYERAVAAGVWSKLLLFVNNPLPLPTAFTLEQNYPNPFNPETTIQYSIPVASNVVLKVYNMLGQEVATLVNGSVAVGNYNVKFDGSHLSSGVYIYRLQSESYSIVKKMVIVK